MSAWALRQRFGPNGLHRVCFRNVSVGIYGPAAPVTVASWDTPCKRTALVRAYSDFVIRGLGLQHKTHYAQAVPSKAVRVTFMSRRASSVWPEKRYCNDTSSFFLCRLWSGEWGIRKLGRMLQNEAQVIQGLKSLESRSFGNGAVVEVRDVDYNVLSIEQQIEVDLQTDVMVRDVLCGREVTSCIPMLQSRLLICLYSRFLQVGPHGAGLMHNIFMRDRAALVEMFVDGSGGNRHFHNLAFWYGRTYNGESYNNPVQVDDLVTRVSAVIEAMDLSSY